MQTYFGFSRLLLLKLYLIRVNSYLIDDLNSVMQLAKLAGNTVVATCGGEKKATLLRSLGVDRVIDYRKEDIKDVCLSGLWKSTFYVVNASSIKT